MNIQGTTVLVLGGAGMVGRAVCRELIEQQPSRIIVSSLFEQESKDAIAQLKSELQRIKQFAGVSAIEFIPEWGNLFVRNDLKDQTTGAIARDKEGRQQLIEDIFSPLTRDVLERSYLYQMIHRHQPDIIIDGINTATAIAYGDIFSQSRKVWEQLKEDQLNHDTVEQLLCTNYIPQLIRHVDILYRSMAQVDTKVYLKLGTSGTGGMGWNIPYTHGEERPSPLILSKSAVAGAHTLLLFLLARTPGVITYDDNTNELISKPAPTTMEIKPTAMIGWRSIGYGAIKKKGQPVLLEDVTLDNSKALAEYSELKLNNPDETQLTNQELKTVFIDTGENGQFSTEEFVAITSPGQMEFVTPEEIARNVVDEVRGVNTGKDVINALNVTCMGPTYRAGYQRHRAIEKLRQLEAQHDVESIAFENLGPPRLSKLLYEASLLKSLYGTYHSIRQADPKEISAACIQYLRQNPTKVATPISIGIPIIYEQDGELQLVRGREIKTPPSKVADTVTLDHKYVEEWITGGWIDLRPQTMQLWKTRIERAILDATSIPGDDSSSRYVRDREFWTSEDGNDWDIKPGELVAWIFINEDKGERGRE